MEIDEITTTGLSLPVSLLLKAKGGKKRDFSKLVRSLLESHFRKQEFRQRRQNLRLAT